MAFAPQLLEFNSLGLLNVSIRRPRQTQMVSERVASVVRAKQSAVLQDRHDLIDEIVEGSGKPGRHQIEPVRRPRDEPFLKAVGHELWCSAQ